MPHMAVLALLACSAAARASTGRGCMRAIFFISVEKLGQSSISFSKALLARRMIVARCDRCQTAHHQSCVYACLRSSRQLAARAHAGLTVACAGRAASFGPIRWRATELASAAASSCPWEPLPPALLLTPTCRYSLTRRQVG